MLPSDVQILMKPEQASMDEVGPDLFGVDVIICCCVIRLNLALKVVFFLL